MYRQKHTNTQLQICTIRGCIHVDDEGYYAHMDAI